MRTDKNAIATFREVAGFVSDKFPGCEPSIVDLGCGDLEQLNTLKSKGFKNLTGVGYELPADDEIQLIDSIDLSIDGWSNVLGGDGFDVVISTDVIEHLTNPFNFLENVSRILKESGYLILTFPNVHNARSIISYALNGRYSGFFGPNFNDGHPLFDQHIFIPNMHLIEYFLKLNNLYITDKRNINGKGRLFSQTTMIVAEFGHKT